MHNRIAVIGDKDSVLAFKAIGLEVFTASTETEAKDAIKMLSKYYQLIYITDKLAVKIENTLNKYKSRPYPVIVPIPSAEGSNGYGMQGIKSDIEKAIGSDILFNKEDN